MPRVEFRPWHPSFTMLIVSLAPLRDAFPFAPSFLSQGILS